MQHGKSINQSMLEHAALQQRSRKSVAIYAKLIGVSLNKMQYWVRKYKVIQKNPKVESDTSVKFIDLGSFGLQNQPVNSSKPVSSRETTSVSPLQDQRLPQMTLTFPNGICLKIY